MRFLKMYAPTSAGDPCVLNSVYCTRILDYGETITRGRSRNHNRRIENEFMMMTPRSLLEYFSRMVWRNRYNVVEPSRIIILHCYYNRDEINNNDYCVRHLKDNDCGSGGLNTTLPIIIIIIIITRLYKRL